MSKRPKGYWTEERVREEATKYDTKKEFERGCKGAYDASLRLGLIDDLFENQRRSWVEAGLRAEAAKYNTKRDFKRGCPNAYNAAVRRFPGLLDDLFENQYRYWDEAAIRAEATKYNTKKDFQRGCKGAYLAALLRFPGLLDDLFKNQYRSWDEAAIRVEAAKYSTKADFQRGCRGAYDAALLRFPGLIDDLGFIPGSTSDNDTIYIWRAVGQFYNGKPVFKIGVTSARLGDVRIRECARSAGFDAALVAKVPTWMPAGYVEDHLHEFGDDPQFLGFDGATEYRALDATELEQVLHLMNGYACPGEEAVTT